MRHHLLFVLALFVSQCGVEAGNVGKGRTGQVKVLFAQEPSSGDESLSVSVGSLGLIDSQDAEVATLNAATSSVDLYGSKASSVLVAESKEIPIGAYAKIAIRLKGDKPIRYRDVGGLDHDVELEDDAKESFYIAQSIVVEDGEVTTIIVNLDPFQSLARPGADAFVFRPRGELARHSQTYVGTTELGSARWACLYAYGIDPGPVGPWTSPWNGPWGGGEGPEFDPNREMPHLAGPLHGRQVEGRPTFKGKDQLVRDQTAECSSAYAKTSVKDGRFEFRFLDEGTYAVRIFSGDGGFIDLSDDIVVRYEK
jgi:hypothetical protein